MIPAPAQRRRSRQLQLLPPAVSTTGDAALRKEKVLHPSLWKRTSLSRLWNAEGAGLPRMGRKRSCRRWRKIRH